MNEINICNFALRKYDTLNELLLFSVFFAFVVRCVCFFFSVIKYTENKSESNDSDREAEAEKERERERTTKKLYKSNQM